MRLDFDNVLDEHGPFRLVDAGCVAKLHKTSGGECRMKQLLTGGCLCGAVRYECEVQPVLAGHCQCRDCRKDTGTGHSSHLGVPAAALRIEGQLRTYEKSADSGRTAARSFCPTCGSPIMFQTSGLPDVIFLTAGSLDDPAAFGPSMVVFTESAQPWDMLDPELRRFPRMPET
jgi:hypothetical protein